MARRDSGTVIRRIACAAAVLAMPGCAGVAPAQVGQAAGTIAGSAIVPGLGAPVGALVGLLAGMVVQGQVDQATERRERRELGDQMQTPSSPALPGSSEGSGQAVRVWVDEMVRDGRTIAGHFDVRHLP